MTMAVLDGSTPYELFEVLQIVDGVARVRTPFLFEIGEELRVRIKVNGDTSEAKARVRAHTGPADARITELELTPVIG